MKTRAQNITPPREREIAEIAYTFWEEEGRPDGRDMVHWLRAVAHVSTDSVHCSSLSPAPPSKSRRAT